MPRHCSPDAKYQPQWHLEPTVTAPNRFARPPPTNCWPEALSGGWSAFSNPKSRPPAWHSVWLLFLYGAQDSHPFFPSHVASGRRVLSAAAAGAPAGVVSAFTEPSGWCAKAVLDVAGCAVCTSAAPSSWRIGGCAGCCGSRLTVLAVPTPPSSGRPQPASLCFRVREARVPCSATRCPGRPPRTLPHSVGHACAGRVPCWLQVACASWLTRVVCAPARCPRCFTLHCDHVAGGGGECKWTIQKMQCKKMQKSANMCKKVQKKCNHKNAMTRQHNTQQCTTQCAPNVTLKLVMWF